jgi:hypothetical protein
MANTRLSHCVAVGVKRAQKCYHAPDIEKCGNYATRKISIGRRRFERPGVDNKNISFLINLKLNYKYLLSRLNLFGRLPHVM